MMGVLGFFGYKSYILISKNNTSIAKNTFYKDLDKGLPKNYSLAGVTFRFCLFASRKPN
jgi:hypothetical protein